MNPQRIQRQRTKGWRMPAGAVYVGRPSKWGNPFTAPDRAVAVTAYCEWISDMSSIFWKTAQADGLDLAFDPPWDRRIWVHRNIATLASRDLACWCPLDQPCHADVLLELANGGEPS